ncbi:MAG: hypothetical protein EOP83_35390 [Verrucomicrobiaceae bacterium]|nr:MAG: hypothetical protein EOP83_35390 [Verrucomicrobiaceae bacterium]
MKDVLGLFATTTVKGKRQPWQALRHYSAALDEDFVEWMRENAIDHTFGWLILAEYTTTNVVVGFITIHNPVHAAAVRLRWNPHFTTHEEIRERWVTKQSFRRSIPRKMPR